MQREHRHAGRPKGASVKGKAARDEIARGADPEATFKKYFPVDWKRAMKRQAALLETPDTAADPKALLENVAQYGSATDKINACTALLALLPTAAPQRERAITIVDIQDHAGHIPWPANVYEIPSQLGEALDAFDRLLLGHVDPAMPTRREPAVSPLRILAQIIVEARDKDAELVRAAKVLIAQHTPKISGPRTAYIIPDNRRISVEHLVQAEGEGWGVLLLSGEGVDPVKTFWRAAEARWQQQSTQPEVSDVV